MEKIKGIIQSMMSMFVRQQDSEQHLRQVIGLSDSSNKGVENEISHTSGPSTAYGTYILCVDISKLPRIVQFVLLSTLTCFFYLIYGYFQELIFRLHEFRPYGWYLTLVQFAYYTLFGTIELALSKDRRRRIPLRMYFFLAFLTVSTMGLSNTSVGYLNYPTQVIFKCCKLIPVMIGGIFIQGKQYNKIDVTAVFMMVAGLILFTLADNNVSPSFEPYGVLLISLALCADGVIGNFQEKAMKQHNGQNSEMVFYSYGIGFVYIFIGIVISGDLLPAYYVCKKYPMETYGYGLFFSISGYIGLYVVLSLVKSFGALVAVTVTTCRKAVTIILSFLFFTKPFTTQYIWSGTIVVIGIYLNVYSKNRVQWEEAISFFVQYVQNRLLKRKRNEFDSVSSSIV